ncbi:MAG: hypothetical protein WCF84_04125 [Anaerolineae bacterium]
MPTQTQFAIRRPCTQHDANQKWSSKREQPSSLILAIAAALLLLLSTTARPVAAAPADLSFSPTSAQLTVGSSAVVVLNLAAVTNLYGYQIEVSYDASKVSATGAFTDTFLNTIGAFVPPGWDASCGGGLCRFSATQLNPALPLSGSGPLAQITFTGVAPGLVPLTMTTHYLSDRNGFAIDHTAGAATLTVYGAAIVNGTVRLQGRSTPITAGTVTLTDSAGKFPPTTTNFSATTGYFTVTVPVDLAGSNYQLDATHSLYLTNRLTGVSLLYGTIYTAPTTRLLAGDANNDGLVDILDLSCIGGSYGVAPRTCGGAGSSDINADGNVDIFDLVLVGGNYGLAGPLPW